MPKQCSPLACDGEVVVEALACLYGTLGHIGRTVGPPASDLSDSMPVLPFQSTNQFKN